MRHLYSFKGCYYFRSRVPSDLQGLFQCRIIKKSLKTKDFKTATSSVKLLSNELYRVIKVIRSGILNKEQMDNLVHDLFTTYINNSDYANMVYSTPLLRRELIKICDKNIEIYKRKRPINPTAEALHRTHSCLGVAA